MDLNSFHPTEAEAWTYLVRHGNHLMAHKLPSKIRTAIIEVLERKWDMRDSSWINIHDFCLIWADQRYRSLATKLASGPGADVFDIETLNKLKLSRLDGVSSKPATKYYC